MDKHDKKWMIEALNTLGLPMLVLNELIVILIIEDTASVWQLV